MILLENVYWWRDERDHFMTKTQPSTTSKLCISCWFNKKKKKENKTTQVREDVTVFGISMFCLVNHVLLKRKDKILKRDIWQNDVKRNSTTRIQTTTFSPS